MRKFLTIAKPIALCLSIGGCVAFLNWPCIDVPNAKGQLGMQTWAIAGGAWGVLVLGDVVWTMFGGGKKP